MLVDKGVVELEDPKGYCRDESKKGWRVRVYWEGKNIYFGLLKDEQLAMQAGKALLARRVLLNKGDDFKCVSCYAARSLTPARAHCQGNWPSHF